MTSKPRLAAPHSQGRVVARLPGGELLGTGWSCSQYVYSEALRPSMLNGLWTSFSLLLALALTVGSASSYEDHCPAGVCDTEGAQAASSNRPSSVLDRRRSCAARGRSSRARRVAGGRHAGRRAPDRRRLHGHRRGRRPKGTWRRTEAWIRGVAQPFDRVTARFSDAQGRPALRREERAADARPLRSGRSSWVGRRLASI